MSVCNYWMDGYVGNVKDGTVSPLRLLYVNNAQLSEEVLELLTRNILSGQCEVQAAHMRFTTHSVSQMLGRDADTNKAGPMTAAMIQKGELLCSTVSRLCDAVAVSYTHLTLPTIYSV